MAASPDGLVYDSQSTDPYSIVEYKNPYGICDLSLTEAAQSKQFFLGTDGDSGQLHLKMSHSYYYQIQAAMFCTQRKWCDFVVRTSVDLHIERIKWNDKFWDGIVPKLKRFYFEALLPELAQPLYQSGGTREPSDWLKNLDACSNKIADYYYTNCVCVCVLLKITLTLITRQLL